MTGLHSMLALFPSYTNRTFQNQYERAYVEQYSLLVELVLLRMQCKLCVSRIVNHLCSILIRSAACAQRTEDAKQPSAKL